MSNKTMFIALLPETTQEAIKRDLHHVFKDLSPDNLRTAIDDGMNSRLCDLSNVIDYESTLL